MGTKDIHVGRDAAGIVYQAGFREQNTSHRQNSYIQISILSPDGNLTIPALPKSRGYRPMIKLVLQVACQLDNGESEVFLDVIWAWATRNTGFFVSSLFLHDAQLCYLHLYFIKQFFNLYLILYLLLLWLL